MVRCQYKNFTARHPSADSYQDGREGTQNLGVKKRKLIKKSPDFFLSFPIRAVSPSHSLCDLWEGKKEKRTLGTYSLCSVAS